MAIVAASTRPDAPSLPSRLVTWTLTVLGLMNSACPISRLVRPSARSARTSSSRAVRPPEAAGASSCTVSVLAGLEVRLAEDGELLVRGPSVMVGYWRNPVATAEVLDPDGWLHTGDAARVDAHGEIVILGRTRDRIALPNGLKVYPDDVEAALCANDAIRAAVVLESSPGRLGAVLLPDDRDAPDAVLAAAVKAANATPAHLSLRRIPTAAPRSRPPGAPRHRAAACRAGRSSVRRSG